MAKIKKTITPLRKLSTEKSNMVTNKCDTCGKSCRSARSLRIHKEIEHQETFGIWKYAKKDGEDKEANNDEEEDETKQESNEETSVKKSSPTLEEFLFCENFLTNHEKETREEAPDNASLEAKASRDVPQANEVKIPKAPGNDSSSDDKKKKCEICGKSCSTVRSLKNHKEVEHQETNKIHFIFCESLFHKKAKNDAEKTTEVQEEPPDDEEEGTKQESNAPDNSDGKEKETNNDEDSKENIPEAAPLEASRDVPQTIDSEETTKETYAEDSDLDSDDEQNQQQNVSNVQCFTIFT